LSAPIDAPREQIKELEKSLERLQEAEPRDLEAIKAKQMELDALKEKVAPVEKRINELRSQWQAQSFLGKAGRAIEPLVRPLGWDWRIGMSAIASFPAREVMVGTLGIIFGAGEVEGDNTGDLQRAMIEARREGDSTRVFSIPVALSVMVFFALCCQCVSTLVVIKRETNSWRWPIFTFVYMTVLAYVGALLTYQIGSLI
jgi:ferrous iron transport protein B